MNARLTEVAYYRWAGALPVLAPALAYLAYQDEPTLSLLDRVAIPFYVSGLVAGPAYVPFAAVLFWWIRKEPAARYRALSWIAPLLFIPPFLLYLFVMRWWTGSTAPLTDTLIFYGVGDVSEQSGKDLAAYLDNGGIVWIIPERDLSPAKWNRNFGGIAKGFSIGGLKQADPPQSIGTDEPG